MDEIFKHLICLAICFFVGRWAIAEISLFIPEFEAGIQYVDGLAHEMTHDKWMPVVAESLEGTQLDPDQAAQTASQMFEKAKRSASNTAKDMGFKVPDYAGEKPNPTGLTKEEVIDHF